MWTQTVQDQIIYPRLNSDVVSGLGTCLLSLGFQNGCVTGCKHCCPAKTALVVEVLWQCSQAEPQPLLQVLASEIAAAHTE